MESKNIVIIACTIFPSQFPRSYRATELAKELARQGHKVTLYAVLGDYDYSKFEIENGLKVENIGKMYFATLNSDGEMRNNVFDKILRKTLGRLVEFPDIELSFKIPQIIKHEKNIDLLISVAMPFPIHWGCALSKTIDKKSFPEIWAADCGDPYMGNQVSGKGKFFYFEYLERYFCRKTDYIVVPLEGAKDGYYPEFLEKIRVIPQGFRFDGVSLFPGEIANAVPTFAYAGIFYEGVRDPTRFLQYLTTIDEEFKFVIYTIDKKLINPFLNELGEKIEVRDYVPREDLLYSLSQMDFLVNFDNGTSVQSPSKLIDYMLVNRPILNVPSLSSPGEKLLEFLSGNYEGRFYLEDFSKYNIANVAEQFASLIKQKHN